MTDDEIIKALECCGSGYGNCYSCPYDAESCITTEGESLLLKSALDLINRQKAEIESLKHRKTELQIRNQELQHEKSEAIKEFVEKLKERLNNLEYHENSDRKTVTKTELYNVVNWIMHEVVPDEIDNLVKEMTEVQK